MFHKKAEQVFSYCLFILYCKGRKEASSHHYATTLIAKIS